MSRVVVRPISEISVSVLVVVLESTPSTTTATTTTTVVASISTPAAVIVAVLPRLQDGRRRRRLGAVRLKLGVLLGKAVLELFFTLVEEKLVLLGQDVDVSLRVDHFSV